MPRKNGHPWLWITRLGVLLFAATITNGETLLGCEYAEKLCDGNEGEVCFHDNFLGYCSIYKQGFRHLCPYCPPPDKMMEQKAEAIKEIEDYGYGWSHPASQCILRQRESNIIYGYEYNLQPCLQYMVKPDPIRLLREELALEDEENEEMRSSPDMEGIVPFIKPRKTFTEEEPANGFRMKSNNPSKKSYVPPYRGTPLYQPNKNRDKFVADKNRMDEDYDGDREDESVVRRPVAYTEGGAMPAVFDADDEEDSEEKLYKDILEKYKLEEADDIYQRMERLDVKKPGPFYKVNNFAFDVTPRTTTVETEPNIKIDHRARIPDSFSTFRYHHQPPYEQYDPGSYRFKSYHKNNNMSYVSILVRNKLKESDGTILIGKFTKLLYLPPGVFLNPKINNNKLTFHVGQNIYQLNATDVKNRIDDVVEAIKGETGIQIISTSIGYGDPQAVESTTDNSEQYDLIDTNYAYIQIKEPIREYKTGNEIVKKLELILRLPKNTLNNIRVGLDDISFKVQMDDRKQPMNASEIAKKIDEMRDEIDQKLGVQITSVGIGNKDKLPTVYRLDHTEEKLYTLAFVACGIVAAILFATLVLYLFKGFNNKKDKNNAMGNGDKGKEDYQDLCRGRAAGKPPLTEVAPGRKIIASLSKESDSASSRSSTSSWIEEPVMNMDIVTGHRILSYMENHIKNKSRLDLEWKGLCAYQSEPSSFEIAQRNENMPKNRYVNALPYDHARIILNPLSNTTGSDYINASTITDYDPNTVAYIATQGPLAQTVVDFWQMVWEQGSVVIVMLTKLVENDSVLCHRYWPQEGSEVYNIYEVHLVSEHIWCDDFLVRSFYLKNLKTTETRTVTQFHFLTWPEGGIPGSAKPLLEFRRKVNKSFRSRSCPVIVHCSDGNGRTGAYMLLDMVLNRIAKGAQEIDIAATLEVIRDNRAGAVATKQQLQFVLHAVAEEVQAIIKALPQQPTTFPAAAASPKEGEEQLVDIDSKGKK